MENLTTALRNLTISFFENNVNPEQPPLIFMLYNHGSIDK